MFRFETGLKPALSSNERGSDPPDYITTLNGTGH